MSRPTRRTLTHLAILTLACVACYFTGLDTHGLANSQEAFRLTAAREMQARGDLILPTQQGQPYIAKPPVMYWLMIGVAELRSERVGLFELRFVVALGGLLGVLATYLAGRVLLYDKDEPGFAPAAAFYSALGLAGGVLYARSSRMGELDILMVPTVTLSITCIAIAWNRHAQHARTHWPALACATTCSAIAALTKGPVPLAIIACCGYGAIVLEAVLSDLPHSRAHTRAARALAPLAGLASLLITVPQAQDLKDWLGVLILALTSGLLAWGLVRASEPARFKRWFGAFSRTHPVLVLGAGALAFWWWLSAVEGRVDPDVLARLKESELSDNLRLLVPTSPVNNLGFVTYALGPMSVACMIALYWIARDRPPISRGKLMILAWLLLGLVVFSTMGKGVGRYLTPLWPSVALLGGWWLACAIRDIPTSALVRTRWKAVSIGLLVVALAINGWWYADGRNRFFSHRTPRDFARALSAMPTYDADRLGAYEVVAHELDDHLDLATQNGQYVIYWIDHGRENRRTRLIERLFEQLASEPPEAGPYTLLAYERAAQEKGRTIDAMLLAAGIVYTQTPASDLPRWEQPGLKGPVRVLTLFPER